MFLSTMRKRFHMTFENGLAVSVQWGAGNYCDNHFPKDNDFSCTKDAKSTTAEIAIIYKDTFINPIHFTDDDISSDGQVSGWLTAEEVAKIIYNVSVTPAEVYIPWYEEAKATSPF